MLGGVVDPDEGRGINDGILELLHGIGVLVFPNESSTYERAGNRGVVLDPNMHVTSQAQECQRDPNKVASPGLWQSWTHRARVCHKCTCDLK